MRLTRNKQIIVVVLLAVVLAGGSFVLVSKWTSHRNTQPQQDASVQYVDLQENKATPDTLTLQVGQTVLFRASDGKSHKLAEGEGNSTGHTHGHQGGYTSGEFGADEAWRVTFNKTGTFFLHDHKNPKINVLIVVYEKKA